MIEDDRVIGEGVEVRGRGPAVGPPRTELWIDGTLIATGGAPNIGDNGNFMQIGGNPDAPGRTWNGTIDDVAIWDRPLIPSEIAQIYNGGTGASIRDLIGIPFPIDGWRDAFYPPAGSSGPGWGWM